MSSPRQLLLEQPEQPERPRLGQRSLEQPGHAGLEQPGLEQPGLEQPGLEQPRLEQRSFGRRATAALVLALATLPGCGDDATYTPDACPPQHEYDIRELYAEENQNDPDVARLRAGIEQEVEAAAEKGCVTKPTYTPPLDD